MYNIRMEFGVPMKLLRLTKMCLNETYSTTRVGICLTCFLLGMVLPLLFNFALQYAIRRIQVNHNGLKLNGTHQLWIFVDDVNVMGGSIHTIKKNAGALLVSCKETDLEGNADKTKSRVMSRDRNAGRSHNIKIDNISFEKGKSSNIWEQP